MPHEHEQVRVLVAHRDDDRAAAPSIAAACASAATPAVAAGAAVAAVGVARRIASCATARAIATVAATTAVSTHAASRHEIDEASLSDCATLTQPLVATVCRAPHRIDEEAPRAVLVQSHLESTGAFTAASYTGVPTRGTVCPSAAEPIGAAVSVRASCAGVTAHIERQQHIALVLGATLWRASVHAARLPHGPHGVSPRRMNQRRAPSRTKMRCSSSTLMSRCSTTRP